MITSYVVLVAEEEGRWRELAGGPFSGHNDRQAIRAATEGLDQQGRTGTFVAAPARSWRERTRKVEISEVDRWS